MSSNRDKSRDRAMTRAVAVGKLPTHHNKRTNWLGHYLNKDTSRLDALLLNGATFEKLEAVRGATKDHLYHLKKEHGLNVTPREGKLYLSGGTPVAATKRKSARGR